MLAQIYRWRRELYASGYRTNSLVSSISNGGGLQTSADLYR
ncbi:hypothetical protein ACMV5L_07715 [Serratia plymuthica]